MEPNTKRSSHDLHDFMRKATQNMASDYDRIRERAQEDSGTAGDQGEENWASLFRNWLPPAFQVRTKGRILHHQGIAGPQVDVLILHPAYPRALLDNKHYLAGGVAAAFECKLTVRAGHIKKAVANAVEIKQHLPTRQGTPYKELHAPLIYGLLAHSHNWKHPNSTPAKNVSRNLQRADRAGVHHPRLMLDVLCVADLGTWIPTRISWFGPHTDPDHWDSVADVYAPNGNALTGYLRQRRTGDDEAFPTNPIGALLSTLLRRLAWENPEIRPLAEYFFATGVGGTERIGEGRHWPSDIYSMETSAQLTSRRGVVLQPFWDEWKTWFL